MRTHDLTRHAPPDGFRQSADADASARPVYRNSVIPGGVYSAAEVRRHVATDRLVSAHYRGLGIDKLNPAFVETPLLRYVSFRKDGEIYWTREARRVPAGEVILSDGQSMLRARCGNRLSGTPQQPVLPPGIEEPDEFQLSEVETAEEGLESAVPAPPSVAERARLVVWPVAKGGGDSPSALTQAAFPGNWPPGLSPLAGPFRIGGTASGPPAPVQVSDLTATVVAPTESHPPFPAGSIPAFPPVGRPAAPPVEETENFPPIVRPPGPPVIASLVVSPERTPAAPPASLTLPQEAGDRPPSGPVWSEILPRPEAPVNTDGPAGPAVPEPAPALLTALALAAGFILHKLRTRSARRIDLC